MMHYVSFSVLKPELARQGVYDWPPPGTYIRDRANKLFRITAYTMDKPRVLVERLSERRPIHRWHSTAFGNGFPKGGTMLLGQILATVFNPATTKIRGPGTIKGGWGKGGWPTSLVLSRFRMMKAQTYISGHVQTTDKRVVNWIKSHGVPTIFIYRNLRDVVVSYAHHCEIPDDSVKQLHPDRSPYKALPSHEARLAAAISGIDQFAGIREFWEAYAGWLEADWVMSIKYEEVRADPLDACARIASFLGKAVGIKYNERDLGMLAETMAGGINPERSPTFRAGRVGDWRQEFTPELLDLFYQETGNWTERLGYER